MGMSAVRLKNNNESSNMFSVDKDTALLAVSHFQTKGDFDRANKMLGIISRSIKEDKKNYFSTNIIRLFDSEEVRLFKV